MDKLFVPGKTTMPLALNFFCTYNIQADAKRDGIILVLISGFDSGRLLTNPSFPHRARIDLLQVNRAFCFL